MGGKNGSIAYKNEDHEASYPDAVKGSILTRRYNFLYRHSFFKSKG